MISRRSLFSLLNVFVVAVILCLCSPAVQAATTTEIKHQPATLELMQIVEHSPELKALLEESIAKAAAANPNKNTNPVQSLDEYYAFIDWAATAMPWSILPGVEKNFPSLFDQIDQSLDYFYFLVDQPLDALKDKGYYNNSLQYHEPYRSWLIRFVSQWGQYMNTPESWNEEYYQVALNNEPFGLQKGWYESPSNWKTFNDFFGRRLSSPSARPIASPGDDAIVVAPADSVPQGVWNIDAQSHIENGVAVKSTVFTSIPALLGKDSKYADAFAGGTLTHTFLNVHDYHRYHFPVAGKILEMRIIWQDDAVGGVVYYDEKLQRYMLDCEDYGWQAIETRGCVILETEKFGLVALLPVGMSQVSSVNFENDIKPGQNVAKGDMLGSFLFGGSDFIMIFQKGVHFELTAEKEKNGAGYKHLLMGEEYGRLSKK